MIFFKFLFFRGRIYIFRAVHSTIEGTEASPLPLTPTHAGPPPLSIISQESGAFVTADGLIVILILIHLNHPEPIVCARVYSWYLA